MNINRDLIEDYNIDTMDIVEALANCVLNENEREEFDKSLIENAVYWVYASARNEFNHDYWRAFYNLLQTVARDTIVPF